MHSPHTHTHTHTHIHTHTHTHFHTHTHTHTYAHTHTHRVVYQGSGMEEKVFEKRKFFKEDIKALTEVE